MSEDLVVGIDLGTTNTCVACFTNNELNVIPNKEGKYTTLSYSFFTDEENVVVGDNAEKMASNKPEHGIYEMKRFIGRQFIEIDNIDNLPFVVKELGGQPFVYFKKYNFYRSPEQICTHILRKIKDDVSEKLGTRISKTVITVPAHFNVSQRQATLQAAKNADLTVLKLLNEPTAAALDYFYENKHVFDKKFSMVFDLGGGTFDVSIVKRSDENITILGVDGDSFLGGHDFDNLIMDHVCLELEEKYDFNVRLHNRNVRRLKGLCKEAKECLSAARKTSIVLEGFVSGHDVINIELTRDQFENFSNDLLQKTIDVLDRCMKNCKLEKDAIGKVILAGGSSRIPKLHEMIKKYFHGKIELSSALHREHCVAKGAALKAAMLSKNSKQKVKKFQIKEVVSGSIGIGDATHKMNVIIKKNTPIPAEGKEKYANFFDQAKAMHLKVYQGERPDARKNTFLGNLKITDLTPAPPEKCIVTVLMKVDENGILTIDAKEKHQNEVKSLQVAITQEAAARGTTDDVEQDGRFLEFAEMKEYFLRYCIKVLYYFDTVKNLAAFGYVHRRCQEIQKVMTKLEVRDGDKLLELGVELRKTCGPIAKKYNFKDMPTSSAIERKIKNSTFSKK